MEEFSPKQLRRTSNWNSAMILMFVGLVLAASAIINIVLKKFIDEDAPNYMVTRMLVGMIVQYVLMIPIVMVFRSSKCGKESPTFKSLICKPQQSAWWIIRWILIWLFFTYVFNFGTVILTVLIQLLTGAAPESVNLYTEPTVFSAFVTLFATMVLAPLFEEFFFRGTFANNCKEYGSWHAIIAIGIFFGLWHMNFAQTFATMILGMGAAFMMLKTKSIIPSILLHLSLNTIGGIMNVIVSGTDLETIKSGDTSYFMDHSVIMAAYFIMIGIVMLVMGSGFILFLLEIFLHKESFKFEDRKFPEVSEAKKLAIYFSAPVTIIAALLLIAITVYNAIPK